jgi:hypothetical protein
MMPLLLLSAILTTGCVSRGSASGMVAVQGRVVDTSGRPIEGLKLEVLLPQAYGLREKELAAGQKMDFGMPKRVGRYETDAKGQFEGSMGEQGYQRDVWVVPPRGPVPASPPPPAFLVRLPGISEENYYVCTEKGVCVVMKPDGARIPLSESKLVRADSNTHVIPASRPGTQAVIEMVVDAEAGRLVAMDWR